MCPGMVCAGQISALGLQPSCLRGDTGIRVSVLPLFPQVLIAAPGQSVVCTYHLGLGSPVVPELPGSLILCYQEDLLSYKMPVNWD